jgi:hypothetical protein
MNTRVWRPDSREPPDSVRQQLLLLQFNFFSLFLFMTTIIRINPQQPSVCTRVLHCLSTRYELTHLPSPPLVPTLASPLPSSPQAPGRSVGAVRSSAPVAMSSLPVKGKEAVLFPGYIYAFTMSKEPDRLRIGFTQRSPSERVRAWATVSDDRTTPVAVWYTVHACLSMQLISKTFQSSDAPQRIHEADHCWVETFAAMSRARTSFA